MKCKKKDLIQGLSTLGKFTSKLSPVVLIDGPGQRMVATDFTTYAMCPIKVTDFTRTVEKNVAPIICPKPDDDFTKAMKALKKEALLEICSAFGIEDPGTNPKRVEAIYTAAEADAAAHQEFLNALPGKKKEGVDELICVDPKLLLDMVRADSAKSDDQVELRVQSFSTNDLFQVTASALQVGDYYGSVPLKTTEDFPGIPKFNGKPCGIITGELLGALTSASITKETVDGVEVAPFKQSLHFDHENQNIVSTDGSRIHIVHNEFTAPANLNVPAASMKVLATMAKKDPIDMKVTDDASLVRFSIGKTLIVTIRNDSDLEFPSYLGILNDPMATVEMDTDALSEVLNQVAVAADEKPAKLTFNGGLNVECSNDNRGDYERANVPYCKGSGPVEPEITSSYNVKFLRQAVGNTKKSTFIGVPEDPGRPLQIHTKDKGFQAVVMPMRAS